MQAIWACARRRWILCGNHNAPPYSARSGHLPQVIRMRPVFGRGSRTLPRAAAIRYPTRLANQSVKPSQAPVDRIESVAS